MRAYSASSEEALHARNLLKDWLDEGFLTESQYQSMQQETVCDFRRTNIFLRFVLFFFTLLIVGAAAALILPSLSSTSARVAAGVALFVFAAGTYAGAEFAVSEYHLYRHGIEEALAVCSVGFLCAGMTELSNSPLAAFAGVAASLWIWHRFGFAYAFLAAMVFVVWLTRYSALPNAAQHLVIAATYAAGLITVAWLRARQHVFYRDEEYSMVEALLWLGIYLAINLKLSPAELFVSASSGTFYWLTWALTWFVPPIVLWRGLWRKDRFVIAAGGITAVLTLITNKSYLGWERHTWDPMLLGALLAGLAVVTHRWLARGPSGIRHGFTARRLSGKDKRLFDAGSMAFGVVAPGSSTMHPHIGNSDVRFGGGQSGGGGASSDF